MNLKSKDRIKMLNYQQQFWLYLYIVQIIKSMHEWVVKLTSKSIEELHSTKTVARNSVLNPKTTFKKSQENTENKETMVCA